MGTSLGEGIAGTWDHLTRLGPTLEYVLLASLTSLSVGFAFSRFLESRSPSPPGPPPATCPPCQCFCACGPLPPAGA